MSVRRKIRNSGAKSQGVWHVEELFPEQSAQQADDQIKLPIESPKATSGLLLQHINDDCLMDIFSVKSLTVWDLGSLAETCTLFQRITQRVFPRECQIDISEKSNCCVRPSEVKPPKMKDVERIFKNFGSAIAELSISISSSIQLKFVCRMITKYCVNKVVVKILYMTITEAELKRLAPISKQLRRLELHNVDIDSEKTLFADLTVCPKLEHLTYMNDGVCTSPCVLSFFISRHVSLKSLELAFKRNGNYQTIILQTIGQYCNQLEELKLSFLYDQYLELCNSNVPNLSGFNHLKTLQLTGVYCKDLKFVSGMPELRNLCLTYCVLPTDGGQYEFLKKITQLYIALRDDSFDVMNVIRRLVNLKYLRIQSRNSIYLLNEETFYEIVRTVEGRLNTLTIKCKFDFPYNSENREQNVSLIRLRY